MATAIMLNNLHKDETLTNTGWAKKPDCFWKFVTPVGPIC